MYTNNKARTQNNFPHINNNINEQNNMTNPQKKPRKKCTCSGRDAKDLGPLPKESVILLSVLAGVWVLIGAYYITEHVKKKTGQNS